MRRLDLTNYEREGILIFEDYLLTFLLGFSLYLSESYEGSGIYYDLTFCSKRYEYKLLNFRMIKLANENEGE